MVFVLVSNTMDFKHNIDCVCYECCPSDEEVLDNKTNNFLELVKKCSFKIIRFYYEKFKDNIDITKKNQFGKTALILAVETGKFETVKFIGSLGNVLAKDNDGMNALHHLFMMDEPKLEIAYYLMELGVPLFEPDLNNKKPLDYVQDPDLVEMVAPRKRRRIV